MRTRGFTLIEIVIVLSTAVIILGVAALSLGDLSAGRTIDVEARELVAVLQSAQEKSIGQDSDSRWGVYFDSSLARDTYYIFKVDEAQKSSPAHTGIPGLAIDSHALRSPAQFVFVTAGVTSSLIFNRTTGQPTATTTIQITDGDAETAKQITVSRQGKIDYQ